MRADRDRFVALAFSAADLLVELDRDQRVVFAAGAMVALTGWDFDRLVGMPFTELVAAEDRSLVQELLLGMSGRKRMDDVAIRLAGREGSAPLILTGYRLDDLDGHYFLALQRSVGKLSIIANHRPQREKNSGLLDRAGFTSVVGERISAARESGDDLDFTLLQLNEAKQLRERLDAAAQKELDAAIGACLRARSVGGDSAGRFDDSRFGIVHRVDMDIAALQDRIQDIARQLDPEGVGLSVDSATVGVGGDPMGETDIAKALLHAINQFCDEQGQGFTIRTLSESLTSLADTTRMKVEKFNQMIESSAFEIAFQPIVNLSDGRPHHFEALVRLDSSPISRTSYEFVTYAEEIGQIHQFDIAMCRKVLTWLETSARQGHKYMVAVNLSGGSLERQAFVTELHALLSKHESVRHRLLFEITESARIHDLETVNRLVQSLRRQGHHVCLDDFGSGQAAFQYLRTLDVDMVKIDGRYIQDAMSTKKGRSFLRAMAGLLAELNIATVAEMIEDSATMDVIRECGIGFGQGYLFGRPSPDIGNFEAPRPILFEKKPRAAS